MIEFRTPVPGDRDWVTALLAKEGLSLCNYSFPVLFCWQGAYQFQLARLNHRLLVRLESSLGRAYLWPVGEGDPAPALAALTQDAHSQGHPLRLISLTLYHKNWLEDRFPGRFSFAEARDGFDYLYAVDRLADHAAYIADLVGAEHVACGFDFCGYLGEDDPDTIANETPELANSGDCLHFIDALRRRGFSETDIDGIASGNFLRVLGRVVG